MNYKSTTLIVGCMGNMGKRYSLICKHLGIPYVGIDQESDYPKLSRAIVATPTSTHEMVVKHLVELGYQEILCEKPLAKDSERAARLIRYCNNASVDLQMVAQYIYCEPNFRALNGPSFYNYFKTGNDGLIWDCIQILGMAREGVEIKNNSPIWKCSVNGSELSLADMDEAYIKMVHDWASGIRKLSNEEVYEWHQKVEAYEKRNVH